MAMKYGASTVNSAAKEAGSPAPKPTPITPRLNLTAKLPTLPHMHDGGPVLSDGAYELKAGEHVLTEAQAKAVRHHALMSVGMKSLGKKNLHSGELSTIKKGVRK